MLRETLIRRRAEIVFGYLRLFSFESHSRRCVFSITFTPVQFWLNIQLDVKRFA